MGVEELIYAAGGLTEKAYKLSAEISRTGFNDRQVRNQERFEIDLNTELALGFKFQSRDVLQIRSIPEWVENHYVTLTGEVRFPGQYPIHKDDTLRDVLDRAGGVTDYAYVPGSLFTREELQKQQENRLADMQRRLAEDIAKAQLVDKSGKSRSTDLGTAQELLFQLQNTPAVGRLVIDLAKVIKEDPDYLIPLQHGDTLNVPARKNSVTIIGEVQLPISQVFEPALEYNDYIDRSGGITDKADEERIYVIKANGGVQSPGSSNWFSTNDSNIDPGDTIVVPLDADKLDQLVLWRDVSQIFYQIALGAAAVGSL
jgi:protein involved in polysaccharide export with SLBB domain